MSLISLFFIGLALICQTITACDQSKKTVVDVDLYYESLCRDSMNFISTQLVPNYDALKDHLKINFVPFGKSSYRKGDNDKRYEFTCQHGPDECSGNRAQACAIQIIDQDTSFSEADRQKQIVDFVGCVMSKNPVESVKECALQARLSEAKANEILTCSDSIMGDQLLVQHGEKTSSLSPSLSFVPTIVLNNSYSKDYQNTALRDFRQLICSYLTDDCDASNLCDSSH